MIYLTPEEEAAGKVTDRNAREQEAWVELIAMDRPHTAEERKAAIEQVVTMMVLNAVTDDVASLLFADGAEAAAICPCFAGDTLVETEDGLKPISEVREGEQIWAADPDTGERALRTVLRRYVTPGRPLVEVDTASVETGAIEAIRATPGHPFWVEERGWVGAAELAPGDTLHTGDGRIVRVVGGHSLGVSETVYNFDVEGWHTYFVGRSDVLVHNGCELCAGAAEGGEVYTANGGVDFSQSTYLHSSDRAIVQIEYTGSYPLDAEAANAEAGFARTPKGYTWHHLDDYDPATNRGTMQLVETWAHQGMKHFGGVNQWEAVTGMRYLSPWYWGD
jgi:hypothetical protein